MTEQQSSSHRAVKINAYLMANSPTPCRGSLHITQMGDYSDDINTTRVSYLHIQGCVKVFLHKEHSDENLTKTRDRENTGVIRQPEDKSKATS